ncbi:MAG TPA: cysteine synthase family protein [Pyrinomonadaceae bacterium]|nr:cysteine synthase family protein [Pyrinomonadaceae bacterium]
MQRNKRWHDLMSGIGNTPLLRLERIGELPRGVELYAKAEHLNPSGSVKDRAASAIIRDAAKSGALDAGKTILDATSGNTGIAYAMIAAARGLHVTLCLPASSNIERKRMLKIYGAELIETDPLQGTDGAQRRARELAAEEPDKYFYADQYNNPNNWRAHYETTGPEIWEQTDGRVTHFLAGLGTSGTFVGTVRRLRELNPAIKAIAMQPDSPWHGLDGLKHLSTAIVPGIYDPELINETVTVRTEDAQKMTVRLAREEGLFVGVSSGANVLAALRLARELPDRSVVVTVLCDGGERYLSEDIWF